MGQGRPEEPPEEPPGDPEPQGQSDTDEPPDEPLDENEDGGDRDGGEGNDDLRPSQIVRYRVLVSWHRDMCTEVLPAVHWVQLGQQGHILHPLLGVPPEYS